MDDATREKRRASSNAWKAKNKERVAEYNKAYRLSMPAEVKAKYNSDFQQRHRSRLSEYDKERYAKNPEGKKKNARDWYSANKDRAGETRSKWASKNKDKTRGSQAKFRANHPEKVNEWRKKWIKDNPEKSKLLIKEWGLRNKGSLRAKCAKRRTLIKANSSNVEILSATVFIISINSLQFSECAYCNKVIRNKDFRIDHIYPVKRGGKHSAENLTLSCESCNASKGAKLLLVEWMPPNML